jgi:hypothetical protein
MSGKTDMALRPPLRRQAPRRNGAAKGCAPELLSPGANASDVDVKRRVLGARSASQASSSTLAARAAARPR